MGGKKKDAFMKHKCLQKKKSVLGCFRQTDRNTDRQTSKQPTVEQYDNPPSPSIYTGE